MPKGPLKSPRADKGTRRNGTEKDRFYTFRLNPNDSEELPVIDAIDGWLAKNDKQSLRDLINLLVKDQLPKPITREEQLVETFEQQIERLASSIDRLLSLRLERVSNNQPEEEAGGVNMDYLKRIQQTLRGGKK
jgi:hypothetical protein